MRKVDLAHKSVRCVTVGGVRVYDGSFFCFMGATPLVVPREKTVPSAISHVHNLTSAHSLKHQKCILSSFSRRENRHLLIFVGTACEPREIIDNTHMELVVLDDC